MLFILPWKAEKKMNNCSKSTSFNRGLSFARRAPSSGSPKLDLNHHGTCPPDFDHRNAWLSRKFYTVIIVGPLITFLLAVSYVSLCVYSTSKQTSLKYEHRSEVSGSVSSCDIFSGSWVSEDSYPLYNSSECPFAEQGFNCLGNGRKDMDYLKWRWKPHDCEIPRFNVSRVLEELRGKRVSFVGDSMSRTQWESMICVLMTGVEDKASVYEVNGNKITKTIRYLGVRFSSFDLTVEFFRSVFLVQSGSAPKHGPKRVKSTLKLDKLDDISRRWVHSDVLIFNTGHWWVSSKLFEMGCYFQSGGSLKLGMPIQTAFRTALSTWASWIETRINPKKTRVFFRTFEPSHWSNGSLSSCDVTQFPTPGLEEGYNSAFSDTIFEVVRNMTTPVTVLHVTSMSASRSDAHVGNWSTLQPGVADCSHWCLPGVPDVWNEILLFSLFSKNDA